MIAWRTAVIGAATIAAVTASAVTEPAEAAEPESCAVVRMTDPGWTDITATNAVAGLLLDALGYEQTVEALPPATTFARLKTDQVDVFLGNWMPAQRHFIEPLLASRSLEVLRPNLENAKFTLAVPQYVAEAGVESFADLAKFPEKFRQKIYGIGMDMPANRSIQRMIALDDFDLGTWTLIESSEQGMLEEVAARVRGKEWIVFLAWEPHPMNRTFDLTYLSGGDDYFGANYGETTINTVVRRDYAAECPNVGRLFSQLAFTVPMENAIMDALAEGIAPAAAAEAYLKDYPAVLEPWLAGVTARDGKDALSIVQAKLGLVNG